jgi:hypothetical protein
MLAAVYASHGAAPALRFRAICGLQKLLFPGRLWYYSQPVKSLEILSYSTPDSRPLMAGFALGFWALEAENLCLK